MSPKLNSTIDDGAKHTPNGVKIIGEAIVPGASHFIDGNLKRGGMHLAGAAAAFMLLGGPAGILATLWIRGNSFTTSTLGKPLHRAVADKVSDEPTSARTTSTT
jgi:hypothetical protein